MRAAPAKDKKTIVVVSIFGVLLLVFLGYAYYSFFGGAPNPAAVSAPAPVSEPAVTRPERSVGGDREHLERWRQRSSGNGRCARNRGHEDGEHVVEPRSHAR